MKRVIRSIAVVLALSTLGGAQQTFELLVADSNGIIGIDPPTAAQRIVVPPQFPFPGPEHIVVDTSGAVYFLDPSSGIVHLDPVSGATSPTAALASPAGLTGPLTLAAGPIGKMYLLYGVQGIGVNDHEVWEFDLITGLLRQVSAGGLLASGGGNRGLGVDLNGDVLTGIGFGALVRIDPVTGAQAVAGSTLGTNWGELTGVAVSKNGTIFVCTDDHAEGVYRIDGPPPQMALRIAVTPFGAKLEGMCIGPDGLIYVVDEGFFGFPERVFSMRPSDSVLTLLASEDLLGSPRGIIGSPPSFSRAPLRAAAPTSSFVRVDR